MVGLVGVVGAVIPFPGGLVADGKDLEIVLGCGFADPLAVVKLMDHMIQGAFHDPRLIAF